MRFRLVAAGTRMPEWVNAGFRYYAQRMPRECAVELVEIPLGARGKSQNPRRAIEEESKKMLAVPRPGDVVLAMEVSGRQIGSEKLASRMQGWFEGGGDVLIMIGGPDGLGEACRERAALQWSLSDLTLPHGLVRIVVAEQLYRAWSILRNHPYHRA
ncbi:MAG: 23S rRNA (pseudouridine(1915)-N(3))-methyltransferase RlmH [Gammaproteobacteria bacterium]|nr:23S rRNA (pseudouridine(1915)-N(3))-methyltransferase RlmH [Gammaproteobacteria bacterium]